MLERPAWPLCNLFMMLYLTCSCHRPEELMEELKEEIEVADKKYCEPSEILWKFSDIISPVVRFIRGDEPESEEEYEIRQSLSLRTSSLRTLSGDRPEPFDALLAICRQDILARELEEINSLLCGPCGCSICCTGPADGARQKFFEIPLGPGETQLFSLKKWDSEISRGMGSSDDPPLTVDNLPFYDSSAPILINWQNGWSLVMPQGTSCPNLCERGCTVYERRPEVCRKPQIFPYVLEEDEENSGIIVVRNALLAVWDCPYVRFLKDEIASYAAMNELETFFKENKA